MHDTGITFIKYGQSHKIEKTNNFKIFGSKKTRRHKEDSQNLLRSPIPEGGEPKQDNQNLIRSPIPEGGEPKQDSQNLLRSPIYMAEGGEP